MSELANLIVRRGQLKGQLTRIANYIRDNKGSLDIDQITVRLEKTAETWHEFQQVQAQIEEESETTNESEKYRSEFEELYYDNVAKCNKIIRAASPGINSNPSSNRTSNESNNDEANGHASLQPVQSAIKLAAIEIPRFTGVYTEWAAFYDIYMALIHDNKSMSDIQKFFYLRSCLSGDAEKVIHCLQTTAENYQVAWTSLIMRYDNKRVLIQVRVKALFDLEPLKKESAVHLRTLIDTVSGHLKALESLGQTPDSWGALLSHLITSKLDANTRRAWESEATKMEDFRVPILIDFLKSRFRILEAIESNKNMNTQVPTDIPKFKKSGDRSSSFTTTTSFKCYNCNGSHSIYKCTKFLALTILQRIKRINDLKLCNICLRAHSDKCKSRNCPKCARPHNGLLHLPRTNNNNTHTGGAGNSGESSNTTPPAENDRNDIANEAMINSAPASVNAHTRQNSEVGQVLLSTAEILVFDSQNKPVLCRALLDSGSQHNFMTESLTRRLNLKRIKSSCSIIGINDASHTSTYKVTTTIKSRIYDYSLNLEFFALPNLTSKLPLMPVNLTELKVPVDISLADPSFHVPKKVDIILGAEIYFELLTKEQIQTVSRGPIFQGTRLGWVIAGPIPSPTNQAENSTFSLCTSVMSEFANIENQIAEFWRLEEVKNCNVYTLEEKRCKQHFELNVKRGEDGRFTVGLPFRDNAPKLGKSYDVALRRMLSLERRFQTDTKLKEEYSKFMKEYSELGHMEITQNTIPDDKGYYLPHHAVRNESSTSTKLRVVFDASARTSTNVSLNDVLLKGPTVQEDLVSIMTRFRIHKYVFTADIKKMYRQIWVSESQRDFQRILWREDPSQPLNIYRLKTVTYGIVTASYLATACLQKLSEQESSKFPEACQALSRDFYVDDFLGGAMSKRSALRLRDDLITILRGAGLELCKWSSNDPDLLLGVEAVPSANNGLDLQYTENVTKILGLYWNKDIDAYQYKVLMYNNKTRPTKRAILSEIAAIFDPLGLISPVIICFKIIMQKIWQTRVDWDATLPTEIEGEWRKCRANLIHLNTLKITRSLVGDGDIADIQLHGFADASLTAYGACLYLRVKNYNGEVITNLICSKSRVAPLKTISWPRLELLAAVLLVRLAAKYATSLSIPIEHKYFWSDSTVVLSWISSESARWKTFVAHRIGEIHETTSISQWHHVSTKDNPADIVSRGCCPTKIGESNLWWRGPMWLHKDVSDWPKENNIYSRADEVLLEARTVSHVITDRYDLSIIERYSSLTKLIRVTAFCLRFINNASKKENLIGALQADEIDKAANSIIRLVQASNFAGEIKDLRKSGQVSSKSVLLRLHPFLDKNDLLRVGGRLGNAFTLNESQRHPIILPAKNVLTKLIFIHEYDRLMHGGPQAILSAVRQKYWPLNGRNIARSVVHRCIKCFKYRPVVVQPIMGDLPEARVRPTRAFKKTGVDFAGPFMIKSSLRRNAPLNKAYACLFVCFITKAVHVELVGDLTTQAFLNALQRFCDRRGLCTDIYSDNATNFVGANRQLQELQALFQSTEHQERIQDILSKSSIQWHFIPPRSPHFGGLWEAAVKSLKAHLYRTLGNASLTFEELNTILIRVEAILNSRPLTPLSSHPSDLSVLTPGHFLIGDALTSLPDRDERDVPTNRLSRWRRVVQFTQQLWARWTRDYLTQLQERTKWMSSSGPKLGAGTVVLMRDDNVPPLQWPMGRVVEVIHGSNGQVRVAKVRTCKGEFSRAVRYLCPLPFEGNSPLDQQ